MRCEGKAEEVQLTCRGEIGALLGPDALPCRRAANCSAGSTCLRLIGLLLVASSVLRTPGHCVFERFIGQPIGRIGSGETTGRQSTPRCADCRNIAADGSAVLPGEQLVWPLSGQPRRPRRRGPRLHVSWLTIVFIRRHIEPNQL